MSISKANKNKSELRRLLTMEVFEKVYTQFMSQADKNAISQKANGSRTPYGIILTKGNNIIDGGMLSQHFGQGSASKTPYVSWYVVSIYYVIDSSRIVIGIEEDRYPFISKMKPLKTERIGNKKINIAVFYESSKEDIDFRALYDTFIDTSEEVMRIGVV